MGPTLLRSVLLGVQLYDGSIRVVWLSLVAAKAGDLERFPSRDDAPVRFFLAAKAHVNYLVGHGLLQGGLTSAFLEDQALYGFWDISITTSLTKYASAAWNGLSDWRNVGIPGSFLHLGVFIIIQDLHQKCTDLSLHFALETSLVHTFIAMNGFEAASKVSRNLQQILHPRGRCLYVGEWWCVSEWYVGMMQRVKMVWRMKHISCHLFVQDWLPDRCGRIAKLPSAWYIPLLCWPVTYSGLLVWGVDIVGVMIFREHVTDIEWWVGLDWPQRFLPPCLLSSHFSDVYKMRRRLRV